MQITNNSFEELMIAIDGFADNIAHEVANKRFYEMDEVMAIIKTRLVFALTDCAEIKTTILDRMRDTLVKEKVNGAKGKREHEINQQIVELKIARKKSNRLRSELSNWNEYMLFKAFAFKKFGYEPFNDYFSLQDLFRNGNLKTKIELLSSLNIEQEDE